MPGPSTLKKERKLRLAGNKTTSQKNVNSVTKQTHKLQQDLISDIDDKNYLQKPDVIFTLHTFVELFRI